MTAFSNPVSDMLRQMFPGSVPALPPRAPVPEGRLIVPTNREELRQWCELYAGVRLPAKSVCPGHNTPLDYLEYVFFE